MGSNQYSGYVPIEGYQNMPPQNVAYFELKAIWEPADAGEAFQSRLKSPISLRVTPVCGEGTELNLRNELYQAALVHLVFPGHLPVTCFPRAEA